MDIADPRIDPALVPAGSYAKVINGPKGDEYKDLPSVVTPNGYVITRWTFTDQERAAIAAGQDVFVTLVAFHRVINPLFLTVGPTDWKV